MTFHVPERFRLVSGPMASSKAHGNNGAFFVQLRPGGNRIKVVASDGEGWEHVSVSWPDRCPTWDEMCRIKAIFWDAEDCVMQLHPPESEYVNNHRYCLHLWRPTDQVIPVPPSIMVGIKSMGVLE